MHILDSFVKHNNLSNLGQLQTSYMSSEKYSNIRGYNLKTVGIEFCPHTHGSPQTIQAFISNSNLG